MEFEHKNIVLLDYRAFRPASYSFEGRTRRSKDGSIQTYQSSTVCVGGKIKTGILFVKWVSLVCKKTRPSSVISCLISPSAIKSSTTRYDEDRHTVYVPHLPQ